MVTIYTKNYCPYCHKAKDLLDSLNIEYKDIDVTEDQSKLDEAVEKSGFTTVPQVFIGDKCLGGFDDINKLNKEGKLLDLVK